MADAQIGIGMVAQLGPVAISETTLTAWGLLVVLAGAAVVLSRGLAAKPSLLQSMVEGMVDAMNAAVEAVAGEHARTIMPFIATLWIFLVCANLIGLVPGLNSPTRDLSVTAALAVLVFLSVHWFGIRTQGLKVYLRHYLMPNPVMLPFHLISEVTRTVALAVRLFGNMMSLEMAALLILFVAGFLAPVPILMLHIVEALVQAYIFGMLALVYVASGIHSQQSRTRKEE